MRRGSAHVSSPIKNKTERRLKISVSSRSSVQKRGPAMDVIECRDWGDVRLVVMDSGREFLYLWG